jgi:hypothetical protein
LSYFRGYVIPLYRGIQETEKPGGYEPPGHEEPAEETYTHPEYAP